jgi:hypothetical protein
MRKIYAAIALFAITLSGYSQIAKTLNATPDASKKLMVLDASCGECKFGMDGTDCDLAVRINGTPYFVDGVGIKEYGHPHNKNGFCMAVRKAEVQGDVVNGRFKASYFKLLDVEDKKPAKKN